MKTGEPGEKREMSTFTLLLPFRLSPSPLTSLVLPPPQSASLVLPPLDSRNPERIRGISWSWVNGPESRKTLGRQVNPSKTHTSKTSLVVPPPPHFAKKLTEK